MSDKLWHSVETRWSFTFPVFSFRFRIFSLSTSLHTFSLTPYEHIAPLGVEMGRYQIRSNLLLLVSTPHDQYQCVPLAYRLPDIYMGL